MQVWKFKLRKFIAKCKLKCTPCPLQVQSKSSTLIQCALTVKALTHGGVNGRRRDVELKAGLAQADGRVDVGLVSVRGRNEEGAWAQEHRVLDARVRKDPVCLERGDEIRVRVRFSAHKRSVRPHTHHTEELVEREDMGPGLCATGGVHAYGGRLHCACEKAQTRDEEMKKGSDLRASI